MDISPHSTFLFDDKDAWAGFLLANSLSHSNYNDELERQGKAPLSFPIADFLDTLDGREDWLLGHYRLHAEIGFLLNLPGSANLADLDFDDDAQFQDWLQQHLLSHRQIDQALGL